MVEVKLENNERGLIMLQRVEGKSKHEPKEGFEKERYGQRSGTAKRTS